MALYNYSLIASQIVGKDGIVIAFEPTSEAALSLKKSMDSNYIDNILLFNCAVGDKSETLEMFKSHDGIFSPSFLKGDEAKISIGMHKIVPLDIALGQRTTPINFLKIDAEGYEKNVLLGSTWLLAHGLIKIIMIEMSGYLLERVGSSNAELHSVLEGYGFVLKEKNEYSPDLGNYLYVGE